MQTESWPKSIHKLEEADFEAAFEQNMHWLESRCGLFHLVSKETQKEWCELVEQSYLSTEARVCGIRELARRSWKLSETIQKEIDGDGRLM